MQRMTSIASAAALALTSSPVLAHPGDHSGFTFSTLLPHLLETDHLIFIGLIVLVGILAFRAGRRAERQEQERRKS